MKVTKAIIPVAGWGTRMLPITKTIEKSMLPVGMRPVVDYVVQDILAAGITEIYFVVGEQSFQLQRYYGSNDQLNNYLVSKGKNELVDKIAAPEGVQFHYIPQPQGDYGTTVPVRLAGEYVGEDESALVVMGDQFFYRTDSGSNATDLIQLVESRGLSAGLLGTEVSREDISKGGAIEADSDGNYVRIVEKPSPEEAPSNLNNASFYLFDKAMFELAKTVPVNLTRGEFEITDVLNEYAKTGRKIVVGSTQGEYMECGSPEGWLRANNTVAR